MLKKAIFVLSIVALSLTLTGCQPTPETSAVTSKNDGALEAALEDTEGTESTGAQSETTAYQTTFTSADGSITYSADAEIPAVTAAVPVIQVTPHEITPEQAQTIAGVLFDGAEMYEYSEEMSKSELEEAILSTRQKLSDYDAIFEYCGGDEDFAEYMVSTYTANLAEYEAAYDAADETVQPQPCEWTFYPETHYREVGGVEDSMYILATAEINSFPYVFSVCNRNAEDYRIHSVYVYADYSRMTALEFYSIGTDYPTDEDVENAVMKAEEMLAEMGLSNWSVDACEVYTRILTEDISAYPITITASPTYEGFPVTQQAQISNLKTGDEYASNYYYEAIDFEFCGGQLTYFAYQAPLDVVDILNDDVQLLTTEELIALFEKQMKADDITAYQTEGSENEIVSVDYKIDDVEFGLARTRIKNNAEDFYLLPAYTFRGICTYVYEDGMKETNESTIAVINAVDGSVINTELGY